MMNPKLQQAQELINQVKKENPEESVGMISDTYHSFNDLYEHRMVLSAIVINTLPYAWKSLTHEDGTMFDGMFVVGAPTPDGMITYHYDYKYWHLFHVPVLPFAPHFDGHTPEDVLDRLTNFIKSGTNRLVNSTNIEAIEEVLYRDIIPVFGNNEMSKIKFLSFFNN